MNSPIETELLQKWLEYAKTKKSYTRKPHLNRYIPKFILFACIKLEQVKSVFFMSVEILDKYVEVTRQSKEWKYNPELAVVTVILISNKFLGFQPELKIATLLSFLEENNFGTHSEELMKQQEWNILQNIKFELPVQTMYDEMNFLYDVVVEPLNLSINLRLQCIEVMKFYYLYSFVICETLKEIYTDDEHFMTVFSKKLYVPAGVIISAVALSAGLKLISVEQFIPKLSKSLDISVNDLQILYITLVESICEINENYEL